MSNQKRFPQLCKYKDPTHFPPTQVAQKKVHVIRIKNEIKFLYKKRQKFNKYLYRIHLLAPQEWGIMWYTILDSILDATNHELERNMEP